MAIPMKLSLCEGNRGREVEREGELEKSTAFMGNFLMLNPSGNSDTNLPMHS